MDLASVWRAWRGFVRYRPVDHRSRFRRLSSRKAAAHGYRFDFWFGINRLDGSSQFLGRL